MKQVKGTFFSSNFSDYNSPCIDFLQLLATRVSFPIYDFIHWFLSVQRSFTFICFFGDTLTLLVPSLSTTIEAIQVSVRAGPSKAKTEHERKSMMGDQALGSHCRTVGLLVDPQRATPSIKDKDLYRFD